MHFELSWRNVWRHPRRTLIIMAAVVIGVWSMVFLSALMRGMAENMFENGISILTGDLQIHHKGYRSDPVIEHSMENPDEVNQVLAGVLPEKAHWASRVRVNAIAQNARHSAGVTFVGVDPEKERHVSFIKPSAIADGDYLSDGDDRGILIGKALLEKFETRIGHKIVIMAQDAEGEIASKAFRIQGVFRSELSSTEKQYVFVTKAAARNLLKLSSGLSEFAVLLENHDHVDQIADRIMEKLPDSYEVHTWKDLLPMMKAWTAMIDGFNLIWYVVVFIAMGFGIVNTLLMAVYERMREFGLLKALGMKPRWIVRNVLWESFFILILGIVIGDIIGLLSLTPFFQTGLDLSAMAVGTEMAGLSRVIFPSLEADDVILANAVVLVLGLLVTLYPAAKAARITPVEAMMKT